MIKNIFKIVFVLCICFAFTACSVNTSSGGTVIPSSSSSESGTTEPETGKLFSKPVEISMLYGDAASWPYRDDWYVKETIEEKTGVTLKVILVETTALRDRTNILMASGDLPDLISNIGMTATKQYALQGPYVKISENLDKMPNFKAWTVSNPEALKKYLVSDGNLYCLPNIGGGITNTRFWFYRNDVFEKYDLEAPKTSDELYTVLKALKENEPESYPFAYREYPMLHGSWDTSSAVYYDDKEQVFKFGPTEEKYKELVVFLRQLYAEKLIPPDIYSMDSKAWTDMMVQGKTFITYDYVGRVDGLLESGKQLNPDYSLSWMAPINGKYTFSPVEYDNVTVSKAGRSDGRIADLLKYMDWFYGKEAYEVLSWGKEGVTYKVENGEKQFLDKNYRVAYGIGNRGWFGLLDNSCIKSTYSDVAINGLNEQPKYELPENPATFIALNDSEQETVSTIGESINKFVQQEVSLFVIGEKDIDEWDGFIDKVKNMNLDELLKAYTTAYDRVSN